MHLNWRPALCIHAHNAILNSEHPRPHSWRDPAAPVLLAQSILHPYHSTGSTFSKVLNSYSISLALDHLIVLKLAPCPIADPYASSTSSALLDKVLSDENTPQLIIKSLWTHIWKTKVPSAALRITCLSAMILDEVIFVHVDKSESEAVQFEEGAVRCVRFVVKDTQCAVKWDWFWLAGLKMLGREEWCKILIGNLVDRYSCAMDA